MKIGEIIEKLLEDKKWSQEKLSSESGLSKHYLNEIIRGKRKRPSFEVVEKIAIALGVPVSRFVFSDNLSTINQDHSEVPLISWIKAGEVHEPSDIYQPGFADEWVVSNVKNRNAFALRVMGDSMFPEFLNGDIIIVNPDVEPATGDYAVVKINDEVTFKQIHFYMNKIVLKPINEHGHNIIEIKRNDGFNIQIIGKVVEQIRKR